MIKDLEDLSRFLSWSNVAWNSTVVMKSVGQAGSEIWIQINFCPNPDGPCKISLVITKPHNDFVLFTYSFVWRPLES